MLLAGSLGFASAASAAYPDHAIRMIVGFSAGGTTDVVARIVGKEIGDALGQPVVVENRPGAGSNIATEMVSRADPDGYTIYMVVVTSAINQRSEEHTSELQSLMRISYAVFCLKKKKK